jgi:putative flippase GtrA
MMLTNFLKFWRFDFIRFLFVGSVNTLFGYAAFVFFVYLKFPLSLAIFCGMFVGIIFNFFTTGRVVFNSLSKKGFVKFFFAYIAIYLFNTGVIKLFLLIKNNNYLAGALAIPPVSVVSFLVLKYLVFNKPPETQGPPL